MLEYRVLGGVQVARDGDELHVGGPRQRRLLAALLVHRNEVVSTDRLAEAVFDGDPTSRSAATLRTYVMRLRRVVEDEDADQVLVTQPPGYVLRVSDEALDAARFARLVAQGRARRVQHDPVGAASAFRAALDLWGGDAYAEFDGEDWVMPEAQRLAELRSVTEEQLVDAELECGLAAELVSRLEVLVDREPLREPFWARLMVALYRSGRQADALAVMRQYRAVLAREAGLDPSPELEELGQRILAHDEDLRRVGPPEKVVRGYRLGERLGTGRDGTVHAARLAGVDRDLVVRVVPPEVADRPDVVRSFDATMRRVAALHHDAIVPIDDHWRQAGAAWVVLRRMRGGTLRDRLDQGGLPIPAVVDLAGRVGAALESAAAIGVVHGRVIAESVLFDDGGRAYLSDFPLGEVDATPRDDVVAFATLVHEALTTGHGDAADGGPVTVPGADVLEHARAAEPPPSMADLLAEFEQAAGVASAASATASAANPYMGLRAFDESDAGNFFGRGPLVDELVDRLGRPGLDGRLVLVVGASGSGKSSVVRAGLLPRVRAGAVAGSDQWLMTTMTPGSAPFKELAESLERVATVSAGGLGDAGRASDLAGDVDGIAAALRRMVPDGAEALLVVDQLEELFTLADDDVQKAFLDGLVHALSLDDSRLRVVATLRADFYDRPLRFQGFGALVRDATVTVPAMGAAQLEATIKGPADRAGLVVEPPLVAELVAAVVDQPAAMPSLQFTLYELVARGDGRLDLAGYRQLGGVGGAIATRAENLYESMEDGGDVVRHVFEQLVVISPDGEPTRRPTPRSELAGLVGGRPLDEVVEPWAQARLLSHDRDPETREPTVEVAHEALLREWPRLRGWIDADRAAIVAAGQLREAAAGWESLDRDPGALYRGTKLDATVEQLGGRTETLPDAPRAFLEASLTAREQRRERDAERVARQARTNRRLRRQLAALAVAMLVAVVGGLVALDQRGQAQEQATLAAEEATRAEQEAGRAEAEERVAGARELAAASTAVVDEDPELGILLALEAIERTRSADGTALPEAESALHRAVTASHIVMSVPDLGGSVDWSPDGTVFVTEGPEESGLVDIRDAETGESVLAFTGHDADINDVAFSPDGSLLATTGDDGMLKVWDTDTGNLQAEIGGFGDVWGVSFSPNGSRVAAGWVRQRMVRVLDLATGEPTLEMSASTWSLGDSTSFSPESDQLAVAADDDVVVVDVATGDEVLSFPAGSEDVLFSVDWSPDGRWIASGGEASATRVTDATTGERYLTLAGQVGAVSELDWNGNRLATGARDGTTRVWEINEGGAAEVIAVASREGALGGVAFSPNGEQILTGDLNVTAAKIWDVGVGGGAEWINLPTSLQGAPAVAFSPDGETLALTGDGVPAVVWNVETGTPQQDLGEDMAEAWAIEVSPTGELVATIGFDDPPQVHVWDPQSGTEVFTVAEVDFSPQAAAWSPDGELLAVAGSGAPGEAGATKIIDRTGSQIAEVVDDDELQPVGVSFGPDGEQLITQRLDFERNDPTIDGVKVWDWARGEGVIALPVFADVFAIDPTGTRIATGDVGAGGSIWDATTGARLATLTGHTGDITDIAFSPDGDTIATAGADATVRLWSTETGTERLVLHGHDASVWSVSFGPDGDRLASAGAGGARVWALELEDLVDIAESRLTRSLTDDECRQHLHVEACPA